jgi:uncharacterized protein (AIM24 family)
MGKLMQVGKRALTGESLFMTHFTNRGAGKKTVAFASPYPGTIIPVDLSQIGGELLCQRDSFLCAAMGTQVGMAFNQKLGAGLFGGEGFILQRLNGDGMAFIHAGGMVIRKELKGEKLMVDTGCLVGFTKTISYDIQRAGNLKSMLLGGEGLFLATLQGHGTVWLQSLPFGRMAARIVGASAGRQEQGGVVGGLGRGPVDCGPHGVLGMFGHPHVHADKTGLEPVPPASLTFCVGHAASLPSSIHVRIISRSLASDAAAITSRSKSHSQMAACSRSARLVFSSMIIISVSPVSMSSI